MIKRAVFLDRDGVINRDYGYVGPVECFDFIAGVKEALALIKSKGYLLVLITNQSGIARGKYGMSDFLATTAYMQQVLDLHNARFDAVYCCPHHPNAEISLYREKCLCRKPLPGMFEKACTELDIDPVVSAAAGDRARDLEGPRSLGVKNLALIGASVQECASAPYAYRYPDLLSFAKNL